MAGARADQLCRIYVIVQKYQEALSCQVVKRDGRVIED